MIFLFTVVLARSPHISHAYSTASFTALSMTALTKSPSVPYDFLINCTNFNCATETIWLSSNLTTGALICLFSFSAKMSLVFAMLYLVLLFLSHSFEAWEIQLHFSSILLADVPLNIISWSNAYARAVMSSPTCLSSMPLCAASCLFHLVFCFANASNYPPPLIIAFHKVGPRMDLCGLKLFLKLPFYLIENRCISVPVFPDFACRFAVLGLCRLVYQNCLLSFNPATLDPFGRCFLHRSFCSVQLQSLCASSSTFRFTCSPGSSYSEVAYSLAAQSPLILS